MNPSIIYIVPTYWHLKGESIIREEFLLYILEFQYHIQVNKSTATYRFHSVRQERPCLQIGILWVTDAFLWRPLREKKLRLHWYLLCSVKQNTKQICLQLGNPVNNCQTPYTASHANNLQKKLTEKEMLQYWFTMVCDLVHWPFLQFVIRKWKDIFGRYSGPNNTARMKQGVDQSFAESSDGLGTLIIFIFQRNYADVIAYNGL